MLGVLMVPFRLLIDGLLEEGGARRAGWGVALGMLAGLVPPGNLLGAGLMVLLFVFHVNLSIGLLTALLTAFVAGYADPLTHEIGRLLLTADALQPFWQTLADWPLAAWTSFNNTVVLGSLVLGLMLLIPVAYYAGNTFEVLQPMLVAGIERLGLDRALGLLERAGTLATTKTTEG